MGKSLLKHKFTSVVITIAASFLFLILNNHSGFALPTTEILSPSAGGVTLAEVDEFATNVLGDPWDMNESSDLTRFRSDSGLVNSTFDNGIYSAQMTAGDGGEKITLLQAGAPNHTALRIGKIGYNYPINADKYRFLTFRLYKSCTSCSSGFIQWFADDTYSQAVMGGAEPYSLRTPTGQSPPGWYIVTVDLKSSPLWIGEKPWSGTIRELIIHPFSGAEAPGATVKLDWARLTVEDPTIPKYSINWTGGSGSFDVYASPDAPTFDNNDILLVENVEADVGSADIRPGLLPSGRYYIGLDTNSGMVWSGGPLIINQVPQITILKPSKTSGQEYSQTILGNAWDMNDNGDLNDSLPFGWETCVSNPSFSGFYRATLTGCSTDTVFTDARQILGHMDSPASFDPIIDTSKYRYLSFHYKLEGEQDVGHGWVSRFGWWQHGANGQTTEADVMSRDIVLQEGWNTYKLDLWASDIVDEAHPVQRSWLDSSPNRLRWDPAELYLNLLPRNFELDWIKLTAMDTVKRGDVFRIEYELSEANGVDLTFYYDSDTNRANGRSLISSVNANLSTGNPALQNSTAGEYSLYLPIINNNNYPCGENCFPWHTSSVESGTYYICIEVEDAYNSTYRCSESPVVVNP